MKLSNPSRLLLAGSFFLGAGASPAFAQIVLERVNRGTLELDPSIEAVRLAAEGNYLVLQGTGGNVSIPDNNGVSDVFLVELPTGYVRLASRKTDGKPGNGRSYDPSVSADGRWVAFTSDASDLVAGDTNGVSDVFVFDRLSSQTAAVTRVSVDGGGLQLASASGSPSISDDGQRITFQTGAAIDIVRDFNFLPDIYLRDLFAGTSTLISRGQSGNAPNNVSSLGVISGNGTYVAYQSLASDVVANDNNGANDVFVVDLTGGVGPNTLVSRALAFPQGPGNGASQRPSISQSGDWIAFDSVATNITFNDTNNVADAFLYNRPNPPSLIRASDGPSGQANAACTKASISRNGAGVDGLVVAFESAATNLHFPAPPAGLTRIYSYDRTSTVVTPRSITSGGVMPTTQNCNGASVGRDADFLAYVSADEDVSGVEQISNDVDAFLRHAVTTQNSLTYCRSMQSLNGCFPTMSATGTPSVSSPLPYTITTTNLPGFPQPPPIGNGFFFYSLQAPHNAPISGTPNNGLLCVAPPTYRAQNFTSGGTFGACNGVGTMDFNAEIDSGVNPALLAGTSVWMQTYGRDNGAFGKIYSDALWFVIGP